MITTLLRINWLNLRRDRIALGMSFVLPIVFFSIFAAIFGGMGRGSNGGGASATRIIVVDLDNTPVSRRLVQALDDQAALQVSTRPQPSEEQPEPLPYTADAARARVRRGRESVALVIPTGFSETFGDFSAQGQAIEIIHDPADPIVLHSVAGLLQASAMMAAPDVLMTRGLDQLESAGGTLTPIQRQLIEQFKPLLRARVAQEQGTSDGSETPAPSSPAFSGLVNIKATDAGQDEDDPNSAPRSIVAYYAAGIGVMFLLFSMANGAGGSLLEEAERGTLERLLGTNVSMGKLLFGQWLFFALTGVAQVALMFVWAAVVFGLDLWTIRRLTGFVVMTLPTAAAAAAFGIILATLCKSRAQLGGTSTIVILIMSALGGSMVPRFVMPAFMNTTALFTFNGWALDGYLKVFWYADPTSTWLEAIVDLGPQVGMLTLMTLVFMAVARGLARRWQTA